MSRYLPCTLKFNLLIVIGLFFFFFLILRLQSGMQIKELNSQEYEVILVSSGAVGIGRQRLRYRKLVNSRLFCAG